MNWWAPHDMMTKYRRHTILLPFHKSPPYPDKQTQAYSNLVENNYFLKKSSEFFKNFKVIFFIFLNYFNIKNKFKNIILIYFILKNILIKILHAALTNKY